MSDYLADSLESFRQRGIDPDAYFMIYTPRGIYAHAAPSAAEAVRLLVDQHPDIDPLGCRAESLREQFTRIARYEHLPEDEQIEAMFLDSLASARRDRAEYEQLKKGRAQ
jgi:hypothetical protein